MKLTVTRMTYHPRRLKLRPVVEYSEEFAAMILEQEANGRFQDIDVDDMLAMLDRMILEAQGLGSVH